MAVRGPLYQVNLDNIIYKYYYGVDFLQVQMTRSVLIIGSPARCRKIAGLLKKEGYTKLSSAHDLPGALSAASEAVPDVVVLDGQDLASGEPLAIVDRLISEHPAPVVMHYNFDQLSDAVRADGLGVSSHFFGPLTRENVLGSIELGISRFRQCQALREEVGDCKEALRVRKIVERAKGILMKRNSLNEEEAFLRIQKLSRDSNVSMEKIAQSIITASEII
jgi:AmiR/NasT family two-component response regulator